MTGRSSIDPPAEQRVATLVVRFRGAECAIYDALDQKARDVSRKQGKRVWMTDLARDALAEVVGVKL